MEEEYVTVNSVPVKVAYWGGWSPSRIKQEVNKPQRIILMLPGNPGVVEFYFVFLSCIYKVLNIPIWIVSHGGHDVINDNNIKLPKLKTNQGLYDLSGQIQQKKDLITEYLSGVDLIMLGHSIGSKMILELLKYEEISSRVVKCFMFFPTLENMAPTRNGKRLIMVLDYIVWFVILAAAFFQLFPIFFRKFAYRIYLLINGQNKSNIDALLCFIHPKVLTQVFFLANDEMKVVLDLNETLVEKHKDKLYLYYAANDGWTPLDYFYKLKDKYPDIDAHVCENGFEHAFVMRQSESFAQFILPIISDKLLTSH